MRRQEGAGGALIAVIIALVALLILAVVSMNRTKGGSGDREQTTANLTLADTSLESYAGMMSRLPCPADPTVNDGVEVVNGAAGCQFPEGTLPWKTIGMRRDDSFDAWGRKISYRVYSGAGGLTQAGGASMVACDTVEPSPGGVVAGNLCNANADIYRRNTTPVQFLAGKGLTVTDFGVDHTDVAYVLLSFGVTGMGGYSASGVQLDLPKGDEKRNAQGGDYTIRAFSDPDTGAGTNNFFDDLIMYRSIPDMVAKAGLSARDWPEGATFNAATMNTAVGSGAYGDTGRSNFTFAGNRFAAFTGSNTASNFSFGSQSGREGIGVVGGGDNQLSATEFVRFQLANAGTAQRIALTLDDFQWVMALSVKYREQVQVRFYNAPTNDIFASGTQVGSAVVKQACLSSSGPSSFVVEPTSAGSTFNRVEIQPLVVTPSSVDSFFLISELGACQSAGVCTSTLATAANSCTNPLITASAFAPGTVTTGMATQLSFTIANGTDSPLNGGVAFAVTLPTGLVVATTPNVETNCPSGGSFAAPGFSVTAAAGAAAIGVSGLAVGEGAANCTVRLSVASSTAGSYRISSRSIGGTANVSVDPVLTTATLTVQ